MEKVAWVLVRDGRLLVTRNHGRKLFYLPGGRQEPGETHAETLVREVEEELGVRVDTATMRLAGEVTAARDGGQGTVRMICYSAEHSGALVPSNEIAEVAWVTVADYDRVTGAEQQVIAQLVADGRMSRLLTATPVGGVVVGCGRVGGVRGRWCGRRGVGRCSGRRGGG
jgi:8-oxo-dGTP pyrophosphatase MutT (NUDIX family)